MHLTGRTRYRFVSRFLRHDLVVLEVEERVPVNYDWRTDGHVPTRFTTRWRDARPDDLETHQTVKRPERPLPPPPRSPSGMAPPARPQR